MSLSFQNNGKEILTIYSNGSVGFGYMNPNSRLYIYSPLYRKNKIEKILNKINESKETT